MLPVQVSPNLASKIAAIRVPPITPNFIGEGTPGIGIGIATGKATEAIARQPEAAGKIHSDIQRGFIKAEIVSFEDLIREGSMIAAKEKGLVRSEGKEYIMQDGDIVLFKFNV